MLLSCSSSSSGGCGGVSVQRASQCCTWPSDQVGRALAASDSSRLAMLSRHCQAGVPASKERLASISII